MSELLAGNIESRLNVSGYWLMGCDADEPIRDRDGNPYTKESYLQFQKEAQARSIVEWEELLAKIVVRALDNCTAQKIWAGVVSAELQAKAESEIGLVA